jgi:hypothetical protein
LLGDGLVVDATHHHHLRVGRKRSDRRQRVEPTEARHVDIQENRVWGTVPQEAERIHRVRHWEGLDAVQRKKLA